MILQLSKIEAVFINVPFIEIATSYYQIPLSNNTQSTI